MRTPANGAKPFGAPTRIWDLNGTPVEGPDVQGDMMLWCVYNDLDPAAHNNEAASTAPLGIQIEQSTFAFNRLGALGNTIFVKYKIKNLGGNTLDSVFVSQWADGDLGDAADDLVGCDTLPDVNAHSRPRSASTSSRDRLSRGIRSGSHPSPSTSTGPTRSPRSRPTTT